MSSISTYSLELHLDVRIYANKLGTLKKLLSRNVLHAGSRCNSTCSQRGACLFDGTQGQCYCNAGYHGPHCELNGMMFFLSLIPILNDNLYLFISSKKFNKIFRITGNEILFLIRLQ
ncbi:unnamed protein product, partial [Brugia timori]|uniref:EGF-like domain-containing protein n=1 Tax=Brugia timori TaxID=42155 RepID=A0A0R3QFY1_9BILA